MFAFTGGEGVGPRRACDSEKTDSELHLLVCAQVNCVDDKMKPMGHRARRITNQRDGNTMKRTLGWRHKRGITECGKNDVTVGIL